jgi:hypothetical protein
MHTSITLVAALATCLSAATPAPSPTWHDDYGEARTIGENEKKPLALVIGSGQAGYGKLCEEGQLNADVKRLLATHFVCLYVDVATTKGQNLAKALAIDSGKGLVLSDRTGYLQAFYHDGDLSTNDLTKALTRFSDANLVVKSTETITSGRISYYPYTNGGYAPGAIYGPNGGGFRGFSGGRSC